MFKRYYRRRRHAQPGRKDYLANKEQARTLIENKLAQFNKVYKFHINTVSIRNQRTCWGSCTAKKNLNFNYRLLYLPEELVDYVIVHELCHLVELNHSPHFWKLVARTIPEYKKWRKQLRDFDVSTISVITPPDRAYWHAWLKKHYRNKEVWLMHYKKHTKIPSIDYEDAVEVALCFGWIDGKVRRIDDQRYMQRYTPRRKGSAWSSHNIDRYKTLLKQGLITKMGKAAFEASNKSYKSGSQTIEGFFKK